MHRMKCFACAAAVALLVAPLALYAQASRHKAAPEPKPEPTESELVEYIRGALLSLSPSDGLNDNLDATFNTETGILTVTGPYGHCDFSIPSLNANDTVWDVYDPSDSDRTREKLLRLTLVSVSGKDARTCYDRQGRIDATMLANRARFLFSQPKADEIPDFQSRMVTAFQKLIAATGGTPAKDLF
ncbi:MAG TPA: hypothetical protein VG893_00705 [Terracidiphilus sp.]|nr:hypothetical protein [Terracidiphilus sp.]